MPKTYMRIKAAPLLSALTIAFTSVAAAPGAAAAGPCLTRAQLMALLKKQGYSNIELSDPAPKTPVCSGWVGSAFKDGKKHNIYIDVATSSPKPR